MLLGDELQKSGAEDYTGDEDNGRNSVDVDDVGQDVGAGYVDGVDAPAGVDKDVFPPTDHLQKGR